MRWRSTQGEYRRVAHVIFHSGFALDEHSYLNNASSDPEAVNCNQEAGYGSAVSGDGYEFVVSRAVVNGASLPLSRAWTDGANAAACPTITFSEDGETVLALLLACHIDSFVPITSIKLAETFVATALTYNVQLPRMAVAPGFFSPPALALAPLRHCALAWNLGRVHTLLEASRYALSGSELQRSVAWARATRSGMEMLAALALTQMDRQEAIINIISWLPGDLKCPDCQTQGRNVYGEMKETTETVFEAAYPNTYSLINPLTWASSILSDNCPTDGCSTWASQYRFKEEDSILIIRAASSVSQTIKPLYLPPNLQGQPVLV